MSSSIKPTRSHGFFSYLFNPYKYTREIDFNGVGLMLHYTKRAEDQLQQRVQPLIVEMQIYFSCVVQKRVIFHDTYERNSFQVNDKLSIAQRVVQSDVCTPTYFAENHPIKKELTSKAADKMNAKALFLDYKKGKWNRHTAIEEHLHNCESCQKAYQRLHETSQLLQSKQIQHTAPKHLKARLAHSLHDEEKTASWFSLSSALAYSVPALLVGLFLGIFSLPFSQNTSIFHGQVSEQEMLVASHVQSLTAGHLLDIASSDSHNVKPWFNGRLRFSPKVRDFTRQGFPLAGGRLDYLSGESVAALIYRHRKHTINLYISPKPETVASDRIANYKGYNLVQWNDDGMRYSLISDLKTQDLVKLKGLVSN